MTTITTPTFWSSEVTISNDIVSEPVVTALADDSFDVGFAETGDLVARNLDPFGSFTGGNLLADLSASVFIPLGGPLLVQQSLGQVVVAYRETFATGGGGEDNDVIWHTTDPTVDPRNETGIADSTTNEILHDATATANGGTAVVFETDAGPGEAFEFLQFETDNGFPTSIRIPVGANHGQFQFNPSLAGLANGSVAVAYENLDATSGDRDVRLHIYNDNAQDLAEGVDGSHEVLVSGPGLNAAFPRIAVTNGGTPDVAGDGEIVVVWQDQNGVEYRRFTNDHAIPLDAGPRTIAGTAGAFAPLPHVVALNDGGFMVEWGQIVGTESDNSPDFEIALQRFDAKGNPVGHHLFINNPGDQGPFDVSLTTLADGRVVVAFNNETGDATNVTTLDYVIVDPRGSTINGSNGDNTIVGRLDASTINGLAGNDHLIGMNGNDILSGGLGNDTLSGGLGRDQLFGGAGADTFHFGRIQESRAAAPDVIMDFRHVQGDRIDLAGIDADTRQMGDQAFQLIGAQPFHHRAGELHFVRAAGHVLLAGDVNGDGHADFVIDVRGVSSLAHSDFVL